VPGYTLGVGRTLNRKSASHASNIFNVTRNSSALLLYSAMNKWYIYSSGSNVQTEVINNRNKAHLIMRTRSCFTKLLRTCRTEVIVTNFWYLEHTIACLWPYMSTDFNPLYSTHGIYLLERESLPITIYFVLLLVYDLFDYTVIGLLENNGKGRGHV